MTVAEIFDRASRSPLLRDNYIEKVWSMVQGDALFKKSPDQLRDLRHQMTRECLQYFARHSPYYQDLFERLEIDVRSVGIEDLAKLAVPSDMLRGEGQKTFLISDLEQNGETFQSSGTTGRAPVKLYRSPVDLAIMVKANAVLFEYVYGDVLEQNQGIALFMAAPELRHRLSFVAFVELALESKGIELIYGMDLHEGMEGDRPWQKLEPNTKRIMRFLKSREEPKLFFTAPAGVYLLTKRMNELTTGKYILQKLATRSPPVKLGKGGIIVTGGGTKGFDDLPPYDQIVQMSRKQFTAKTKQGDPRPAPFMDVLGMTETLTALIDHHGVMDKLPYPLSEVFMLDPRTFQPIKEDAKEGILCIFNPFTTSWLECFYPGDIMSSKPSDRYYGKEFLFQRRLTIKEGWELQRACGGSLEEMMRAKPGGV
jgi:phenylacetate-CoA ligase